MMLGMAERAFADLDVDYAVTALNVSGGPSMLTDPVALTLAADRTFVQVREFLTRDADFDAIIIAAFGDPAVSELREYTHIPVIGIGEAAIREAARHGAFSIATTTPELEDSIREHVDALGLARELVSIEITSDGPLDLAGDHARQTGALSEAITRCIADGARAVVIGGGPLARSAEDLSATLSMPVINPVRAACAQLARAGRRDTPAPVFHKPRA